MPVTPDEFKKKQAEREAHQKKVANRIVKDLDLQLLGGSTELRLNWNDYRDTELTEKERTFVVSLIVDTYDSAGWQVSTTGDLSDTCTLYLTERKARR